MVFNYSYDWIRGGTPLEPDMAAQVRNNSHGYFDMQMVMHVHANSYLRTAVFMSRLC